MIIPDYNRYDLSEDGVVKDLHKGRVLKHKLSRAHGYTYKTVSLVDENNNRRDFSVIRLLAMTYLEKPDCACVARAKDCDNTNTVLSNVEWVPCCRHVQQAWKSGKMANRKKKERCYSAQSIALVYDTLQTLDEPVSVAELSRLLDITYSTVRYSVLTLIERGRVRRTEAGVEVLK